LSLMARWTINTGVTTAVSSVVNLIVFAKAGFHYAFLILGLSHGGIYTFTMLASLHSRTIIAEFWNAPHSLPSGSQCWAMTNLSAHEPGGSRHTRASLGRETFDGGARCDGQVLRAPAVIDITRERDVAGGG